MSNHEVIIWNLATSDREADSVYTCQEVTRWGVKTIPENSRKEAANA